MSIGMDGSLSISELPISDLHRYASLSLTSSARCTSCLLTPFSTSTILPSHSVQHSLSPNTPSSYHLWIAAALLALSSDISRACASCSDSALASLGCSATNEAEDSAEGIGRSLIALRRDAVVGKEGAHELIMPSSSVADNVIGISSALGWKRSGYLASIREH